MNTFFRLVSLAHKFSVHYSKNNKPDVRIRGAATQLDISCQYQPVSGLKSNLYTATFT